MKALNLVIVLAGLILTGIGSDSRAQITMADDNNCGSLGNKDDYATTSQYGPYDYTNARHRKEKLPVVERVHFSGEVFRLERGLTELDPTGDLDYTLRAFPNHHLALDAMARLHRQRNANKLPDARYSLRCYFDRARRIAPHDATVNLIEGIHLFTVGDLDAAEAVLKEGLALSPQSPEISYNLGLLYARKKQYEDAVRYAEIAYGNGYPLPGLRNQLMKIGAWDGEIGDAPPQ